MNLFIMRHGIAEEREDFAKKNMDDRLRPLTDKGRKRVKDMVDWLKYYQDRVDMVISSPFTRTLETAEYLQKRYKLDRIDSVDWMVPNTTAEKTLREIQALAAKKPQLHDIVLVGHEPHLGEFISYCLTGNMTTKVDVKKGSITAIDITLDQLTPRGKLLWMINPKLLIN